MSTGDKPSIETTRGASGTRLWLCMTLLRLTLFTVFYICLWSYRPNSLRCGHGKNVARGATIAAVRARGLVRERTVHNVSKSSDPGVPWVVEPGASVPPPPFFPIFFFFCFVCVAEVYNAFRDSSETLRSCRASSHCRRSSFPSFCSSYVAFPHLCFACTKR